ncbi:MAG: hypothetical protein ACOYJY_07355 [Acutalibacteraceae bacterium]
MQTMDGLPDGGLFACSGCSVGTGRYLHPDGDCPNLHPGRQTTAADVDGDSGVTAADALAILQYATGKIARFPIEFVA